MERTYNLTEKETAAAIILVQSCLDAMGGKRPSDLEHDEHTWVAIEDLTVQGYSQHEAAGLFSSLHSKGFIHGEYNRKRCETYLATAAWKFIETIWDAHQKKAA